MRLDRACHRQLNSEILRRGRVRIEEFCFWSLDQANPALEIEPRWAVQVAQLDVNHGHKL